MRSYLVHLCVIIISLNHSIGLSETSDNPFLKLQDTAVEKIIEQKNNTQILQVPFGNGTQDAIPELPAFTKLRLGLSLNGFSTTSQGQTELTLKLGTEKIPEIMKALDKAGLVKEAVRLAQVFEIDPLDILGPIIGENTFNGFIDRTIQDSYHKMFQQSDIDSMSDKMSVIINHPKAQECLTSKISNYWKWRCVIYYSDSSGNNSNGDLIKNFYNISHRGVGTFGLGQMQPFLLWSLNDIVAAKTKYEKFDINNLDKPMHIIFNNNEMLAYIAANAKMSIYIYKLIAQVDISGNAGLVTTLYNLGDEYQRAYNLKMLRAADGAALPQVNYMGWYINKFEKNIRTYFIKYQK